MEGRGRGHDEIEFHVIDNKKINWIRFFSNVKRSCDSSLHVRAYMYFPFDRVRALRLWLWLWRPSSRSYGEKKGCTYERLNVQRVAYYLKMSQNYSKINSYSLNAICYILQWMLSFNCYAIISKVFCHFY